MNIVEFPKMGLKFSLDPVAFTLFNLPVYWYGVIIATAFLVAVVLALRSCRKFGFEPDHIIDMILFAAPVAIICARLYYVIFKWSDFRDHPIEILYFRSGGLAIYGGIIGGLLTAYIYARVKKLGFFKLFDFGVPYLVLAQGIGRWGNFVNAEAHGGKTSLPWGMLINGGGPYHPTFLYEFLLDIAVFGILIWYRKRKKADGEVFFLYMILYGLGRMLIEGMRTDSLYIGSLRVSQVLAFLFAVAFTVIFYFHRKKALSAADESEPVSSEYSSILSRIRADENGAAENGRGNDEKSADNSAEISGRSEENIEPHTDAKNDTDQPANDTRAEDSNDGGSL